MIRYNHSKKAPHPYIKFKSEVNNLQRLYGETLNKFHDKYQNSPQGFNDSIMQLRKRYGIRRNELYATYQQELDDWNDNYPPRNPPANSRRRVDFVKNSGFKNMPKLRNDSYIGWM